MIGLQEGEQVLAVYRRHWLVFFFSIFQVGIGMAVTIGIPVALGTIFPQFFGAYGTLILVGDTILLETLWMVLFLIVADYYLDAWLVTNERLIFIELHGIFSRTVASVNLRNIQDISTEVSGILPTIFKYGNVRIQSAGTQGSFVFKQVPHPYEIKDLVIKIRDEFLNPSRGA